MRDRKEIIADAGELTGFMSSLLELIADVRDLLLNGDDEELLPEEVIPEGSRHVTLRNILIMIRLQVERPEAAHDQLLTYNKIYCRPPLINEEVEKITREVYGLTLGELQEIMKEGDKDGTSRQHSPITRRRGR